MQRQLVFPLLEALDAAGGHAQPRDLYEAVAKKVELEDAALNESIEYGGQTFAKFPRDVRWAQQKAKLDGLIQVPKRGHWELTSRGRDALRKAKPGVVVTIYVTGLGAALWGSAEDCMQWIDDESVSLFVTSPPYPIAKRKRTYGNLDAASHVDWLYDLVSAMRGKTTADGSIVLNMGDVWNPGEPTISLYAERLLIRLVDEAGLNLCQRFEWHNPSAMVAGEYVTKRRERVKNAVERIYWLSPSTRPKANNRGVLKPYSESSRRQMARGGQKKAKRPSGHTVSVNGFSRDNGGAIPPNLIVAANSASNTPYRRYCQTNGLPAHPATYPGEVPAFFIELLTDPGDVVADLLSGSNTTGEQAERLGRRWIASEQVLQYVAGQRGRFPQAVNA